MGRRPLLLALLVGALGLAACQQASKDPSALLPTAIASALADRSEEMAAQLDAGDACGASQTLAALRAQLGEAISAGEVPSALAERINEVITRLDGLVVCAPPPPKTLTQTQTQTIAPPPTTTEPPPDGNSSGPGP